MAKKKRKSSSTKSFEHWPMIIGLILVVVSILSIVCLEQNVLAKSIKSIISHIKSPPLRKIIALTSSSLYKFI